jgi:hypothetical protein
MTHHVTCHCGAIYERSETRIVFRVSDDFVCQECDEVLESWSGSRIPVFRLIARTAAALGDQISAAEEKSADWGITKSGLKS